MRADAEPRWRSVLSSSVENLDPGAFAFVMATGIVSTALRSDGAHLVSTALLLLGLGAYGLLLAAHGWRLLRRRRRFAADMVSPRGFAFLTVVAASDVLASRLAPDGYAGASLAFLAAGVTGWLLLGYGVPLALIFRADRRPSLDQVNGTWFLWVVGTQSVAVASATIDRLVPNGALVILASVCWSIGFVQYLLTAGLALARLLLRPVEPGQMVPPYWIFMGAAAISVLSGAKLLGLPTGGLLPREAVAGLTLLLWSFCSWLVPLLVALGLWRHGVRRYPLRYETSMWGMVFPVGMYGVATRELGDATGTAWLTSFGATEAWVALVVWAAVFAAMVAAAVAAGRRPAQETFPER